MRVLVISDIHANYVALETVVQDAEGRYDTIWCLGDVVGYGPQPNECVAFVRDHAAVCVMGNHDWAVLGRPGMDIEDFNPVAREAVLWTRAQLSEESRRYLDSLPAEPVHPPDAPDILVTHASPREPVWEYILTPGTAFENFLVFREPICLVGHTHKPAIFRWRAEAAQNGPGTVTVEALQPEVGVPLLLDVSPTRRLILNPGSVGQPRDNDPRAAYALLDLDAMTWEQRRIAYPVELTQSLMRAAGLPRRLIDRLSYGW